MQTLTIENGGPVEFFEIHFNGPGVYELRGTKGAGKTSVLRGIDLLAGRQVDLTVMDGEKSGKVTGFGVVAPIGGRKRRKGELEATVLDAEKFDIADLIDPPFVSHAAADRHRIKALISLRGVKARPSDYWALVGGPESLETLVPADKLKTDDPVALSQRIKDALEARARHHRGVAEHEASHAIACEQEYSEIDLTGECDPNTLQAEYDCAKSRETDLRKSRSRVLTDRDRQNYARQALEDSESFYAGPSFLASADACNDASSREETHELNVIDLEHQLIAARDALEECRHEVEQTITTRDAAQQHETTCEAWRKTLRVDVDDPPEESEIETAQENVLTAREQLEQGVRIRDGRKSRDRATAYKEASRAEMKLSGKYRELAAGTSEVLTQLIDCPEIRTKPYDEGTRLVVDHPRRGETLFSDLSDGERVRYSIDATIPQLGSEGPSLFAIPQRVWQDLPPHDREELGVYAADNGIYLVTARVTNGPLEVVQWDNHSLSER